MRFGLPRSSSLVIRRQSDLSILSFSIRDHVFFQVILVFVHVTQKDILFLIQIVKLGPAKILKIFGAILGFQVTLVHFLTFHMADFILILKL